MKNSYVFLLMCARSGLRSMSHVLLAATEFLAIVAKFLDLLWSFGVLKLVVVSVWG